MMRPGSSTARAVRAGFGHDGADGENALRALGHEHAAVRQALREVANRLHRCCRRCVIVAVMGAGWIVGQDDRAGDDENHCRRSATPPDQRHDADAGSKPGQDGDEQRRAVVIEVVADLSRDGGGREPRCRSGLGPRNIRNHQPGGQHIDIAVFRDREDQVVGARLAGPGRVEAIGLARPGFGLLRPGGRFDFDFGAIHRLVGCEPVEIDDEDAFARNRNQFVRVRVGLGTRRKTGARRRSGRAMIVAFMRQHRTCREQE